VIRWGESKRERERVEELQGVYVRAEGAK
jgi:hypothetical protein